MTEGLPDMKNRTKGTYKSQRTSADNLVQSFLTWQYGEGVEKNEVGQD